MNFHLSKSSGNRKTGRMAVTTSPETTCPHTCPLKGHGCYAENNWLGLHWRKVSAGTRGTDLATHCRELENLPAGRIVRLNQAGDLPGNGFRILFSAAKAILVAASAKGRPAFTYTHYREFEAIRRLNAETGATVNVSANSPAHADAIGQRFEGLPIATLTTNPNRVHTTPAGRRVIVCPAQSTKGVTCSNCGNGRPLCARKNRTYIIGFWPHGTGKKKTAKIAKG